MNEIFTEARAQAVLTSPIVFFHFCNGGPDETDRIWRSIYDEPVLLAVGFGRGTFKDTLTFTPEGSRRRPA